MVKVSNLDFVTNEKACNLNYEILQETLYPSCEYKTPAVALGFLGFLGQLTVLVSQLHGDPQSGIQASNW